MTQKREWKEGHMTSTSSELHHEGWNSRLCTAPGAAALGATHSLHKKRKCPSQQNCDSLKNWQIPMETVMGSFHNGTCCCGLWHSPAKWFFLMQIRFVCGAKRIFNIPNFWMTIFHCQRFFKEKCPRENIFAVGKKWALDTEGFPSTSSTVKNSCLRQLCCNHYFLINQQSWSKKIIPQMSLPVSERSLHNLMCYPS